jgi:hypothetical protein
MALSGDQRNQVAGAVAGGAASTAAITTGIFTAAAAANAVPVAGQIASGVIALGGLLAKIFVGRRQKKKEAARRAAQAREAAARARIQPKAVAQTATLGGGVPQQTVTPVRTAEIPQVNSPTTSFSGVGQQPTVQQQEIE